MGQKHHVASMAMRWGPPLTVCKQTVAGQRVPPGPQAAFAHPQQTTQMTAYQATAIVGNILKLHGFCAAKNIAAFFSTSLLCDTGAVARQGIYAGQRRGSDRFPLGRAGPWRSMVRCAAVVCLSNHESGPRLFF